jgi:hypothetical protein
LFKDVIYLFVLQLYEDLKRKLDVGHTWAKEVKPVDGVIEFEGMTDASKAVGIKHSVRVEVTHFHFLHFSKYSFMFTGTSCICQLD